MATAQREFELPDEPEPAPHEIPPAPVNYVQKYQAAVEYIRKLETQISDYERTAKVVSMAQAPGQPVVCLDDKGRIYERRPDPAPRGPGPLSMVWVQIPGPLA